MKQTILPLIVIVLAVLLGASTVAAQQWGDQPQPAPDPDGWGTPQAPPPAPTPLPPPAANPLPPPTGAAQPTTPGSSAQPQPPRRIAYSGLRNEADVAPQDVEFLESIVLSALIPLTGKGFEIIPDNNASKFCSDACAIGLASQTGSEFLVHGGVGTFAGGYTVTLKLHRVASSQLIHTSTTDSRPLLGELVNPTEIAAAELARALELSQPPPPPPPPTPQPPPATVQPITPETDPGYWWPTEEEESEDEEEEYDGGFPYPTRGLDFELRAGFNFCAEAGDATCDNFEMGGGGGAFVGVRFAPMFAAGIDFGVYGLKLKDTGGASDVKVSSRNFMLTPRLYLPFRVVEIYLELGFLFQGFYEKGELDGEEYSIKVSSWTSVKLGAGLTFYIVRGARAGDIGLGIDLDYNFFAPKDVELCGALADDRKCDEHSWRSYVSNLEEAEAAESGEHVNLTNDMVDFIQFSFHLTWLIPIF
ncbi:MAG: hypothetical protein JRF63_12115 [Deltaproteobacteria bacterium]|nr:hypothetical protein [Deltaproteobacteria bacterium]